MDTIRGRILIEGGNYSRKYGIYRASDTLLYFHSFFCLYIYIQVKKKAFKINAKIEDVGLNED